MKFTLRVFPALGAAGLLWLLNSLNAQTGAAPRPPNAEEVFKNVQVLRGIPADEFMGTMGIFSAALGMSCEDCHAANDSKWENYAADTTVRKRTARRMVTMVAGINKNYFAGRQVVTCYSCHRGGDHPRVTPNLDLINGAMLDEEPEDLIAPDRSAPAADVILDKYLQATGGSQRLNSMTSWVAKGTSAGYGPESDKRAVEIYAKAPASRTTVIHTLNGDNTSVYDGRSAWVAAPLAAVPVMARSGAELAGARLDAELSFPGRIKQLVTSWRVGKPSTIHDHKVQVLQGTTAGGALATFYFDDESGLLLRVLRFATSPVGRIPTQIDFTEYRDFAGVKLPARWTLTWLDGRENFEVTDLQVNVPIDPAKFARPIR